MYYILLASLEKRTKLIASLKEQGMNAVFHYVPLHSSPAGRRYGRVSGTMVNTESVSDRLLRLPLWVGIDTDFTTKTLKAIEKSL
jgi:dTDP-4-amino-4,6-dideoxygalactose transaminase